MYTLRFKRVPADWMAERLLEIEKKESIKAYSSIKPFLVSALEKEFNLLKKPRESFYNHPKKFPQ